MPCSASRTLRTSTLSCNKGTIISQVFKPLRVHSSHKNDYSLTPGQTGSGKTYTMLGNSSDLTSAAGEGTAGLIPRICVELFQRFGLASGGSVDSADKSYCGNGQASIQVSFCEVRRFFRRCGKHFCSREIPASGGRPLAFESSLLQMAYPLKRQASCC